MTTGEAARGPTVPWRHRFRLRPGRDSGRVRPRFAARFRTRFRTRPRPGAGTGATRGRLRPSPRIVLAAGAGLAAFATVALVLRLPTGVVIGTEDNGDGYRMYCGAGLLARTVDHMSLWKGGVVDFAVGPPSCTMWVPSSAGLVLRAAALVAPHGVLTVGAVAWWYAALVGVVVGVAGWAASASGPWRAAVLLVPLAPLALVPFARFFASTYAEPAGLLGVVAAGCGVAALAVTRPEHGSARVVALVLVGVGGAVTATAKVAYLPVLAVCLAVVVVVLVRDRRRPSRRTLAVITLATVVGVGGPLWGAVHYQDTIYEGANIHDMVFTLALAELGPGGPAAVGLPPDAADLVGNGYFNGPPHPLVPWWTHQILDRPRALRNDAVVALLAHPTALLRALGVGLQATMRADLPYLASGPADPARFSSPAGDPGWSGSREPAFRAVLDGSDRPAWLPTVVVLTALAAAASTPAWRRRSPVAARWCRAAGLGAGTAGVLVVMALLGDGYFEVFKHVWLASYVLAVTALCLVGAVGALAVGVLRRGLLQRAHDAAHT